MTGRLKKSYNAGDALREPRVWSSSRKKVLSSHSEVGNVDGSDMGMDKDSIRTRACYKKDSYPQQFTTTRAVKIPLPGMAIPAPVSPTLRNTAKSDP